MQVFKQVVVAALLALAAVTPTGAAAQMIEDFSQQPESRWRFFADSVMGGVSSGTMRFVTEGGQTHARLSGQVSTANNGGFIQMQMDLATPPPAGSTGVRLIARGNGQRYFVHLRTNGTLLPWQYYQAEFDSAASWTEIRLPFSAFKASGGFLRSTPSAGSLTSVAIVAFGRDHDALVEVRQVGFY